MLINSTDSGRARMIVALALIYIVFAILLNSVGTVILQSIATFGIDSSANPSAKQTTAQRPQRSMSKVWTWAARASSSLGR